MASDMRAGYFLTRSIQSTKFVRNCWHSGHYAVPAHPSGKGSVDTRQWKTGSVRVNVTLKSVRVTIVAVDKQ